MIRRMNTVSPTYVRTLSSSVARRVAWQAVGVVGFALLTAVGAQIVIPVPGSPVPITLQTFFVIMAGMTLGPRLGTASMAFYLLLGMTGYHVFAAAWWSPGNFLGPAGGYLIGFVLAQPILGVVARRGRDGWVRWRNLALAALAANAVIFAVGLIWLQLWLHAPPAQTLAMGLWPFVPGLIVKTALAVPSGRALQITGRLWRAP